MITLDASFVIAHLSPHDAHHPAATASLQASAASGFLMHTLNLAEVLVGAVRQGRAPEVQRELGAIGLRVPDPSGDEPLRIAHLRVATGLKLPDCCALDVALTTGSALATFDDALARAARQRQVDVVPGPGPGGDRP